MIPFAPICLAALAVVMVGAGCSATRKTAPVGRFQGPYEVLLHEAGRPVADRRVATGSREEGVVKRWLEAHPTGWRDDPNSYAPNLSIRGEGFKLNVGGDICVLNYRESPRGDWVQVSQRIKDDDELKALFSAERGHGSLSEKPDAPPPSRIE